MRNLKFKNRDGSTSVVKLPKFGTGKGTTAWYRRALTTAADIKARIVRRGGTLTGTRQR